MSRNTPPEREYVLLSTDNLWQRLVWLAVAAGFFGHALARGDVLWSVVFGLLAVGKLVLITKTVHDGYYRMWNSGHLAGVEGALKGRSR